MESGFGLARTASASAANDRHMTPPAAGVDEIAPRPEAAIQIDDLRLSVPVPSGGRATPDILGLTLTVTNEGLTDALSFASELLSTVSRARIDELLAAMDENPRLRPVRWYYASLFKVAGLRDALAISGDLIDGGVEIRARFAQAEPGGLFRQIRDRARGLATVTVRLGLTAEAGGVRVRLDLSPDVNGTLAKLVLNGARDRPGITRMDETSVLVDLAGVLGARADVPVGLTGRVRRMDVSGQRLVMEVG